MARVAKIAVSIDSKLLLCIERVREQTGESRSALVSRALRRLTREEEYALLAREYVQAYRDKPETPAETASLTLSALRMSEPDRQRVVRRVSRQALS